MSREVIVMSGIAFNGVRTDRAEIKLEPNWQARGRMCGAASGDLQDPGAAPPHRGPETWEGR